MRPSILWIKDIYFRITASQNQVELHLYPTYYYRCKNYTIFPELALISDKDKGKG
jgi:hypothetical protein